MFHFGLKFLISSLAFASVLNFLIITQAFSGDTDDLQTKIELRVLSVVHQFDKRAVVHVKLKAKSSDVNLPGTPFSLRGLAFSDTSGKKILERIEIRIWSRAESIPEEVTSLISSIASDYGATPKITVEKLPVSLSENFFDDESLGGGRGPASQLTKKITNFLPPHYVIAFAILGLGGILLYSSKKFLSSLDGVFSGFTSNLKGSMPQPQTAQRQDGEIAASRSSTVAESPRIRGLPIASIKSIFMDSYWCQFDNYASWLWSKFSILQQSEILETMPNLSSYISYISQVPSKDLGFDGDPYYLKPLEVNHLDNTVLTEVVYANPGLYNQLSQMRTQALRLHAKQRIEIETKNAGGFSNTTQFSFQTVPASNVRNINKKSKNTFSSQDEEKDILSMQDLSLDLKESFPSLGWILDLPEDRARNLLETFSAKKLAAAWIGPQEVLDRLESLLNPRKRILLKECLATAQPSYQSEAFMEIHEATIEESRIIQRPAA